MIAVWGRFSITITAMWATGRLAGARTASGGFSAAPAVVAAVHARRASRPSSLAERTLPRYSTRAPGQREASPFRLRALGPYAESIGKLSASRRGAEGRQTHAGLHRLLQPEGEAEADQP